MKSRYRQGIQLIVDKDGLAQLLLDLNDGLDIMDDSWELGHELRVRCRRLEGAKPDPETFVVSLDKYQRGFLANKMTTQAFSDRYGGVK